MDPKELIKTLEIGIDPGILQDDPRCLLPDGPEIQKTYTALQEALKEERIEDARALAGLLQDSMIKIIRRPGGATCVSADRLMRTHGLILSPSGFLYGHGVTVGDLFSGDPFPDVFSRKTGISREHLVSLEEVCERRPNKIPLTVELLFHTGLSSSRERQLPIKHIKKCVTLWHTTLYILIEGYPQLLVKFNTVLEDLIEEARRPQYIMTAGAKEAQAIRQTMSSPERFKKLKPKDAAIDPPFPFPVSLYDDGEITIKAIIRPDGEKAMTREEIEAANAVEFTSKIQAMLGEDQVDVLDFLFSKALNTRKEVITVSAQEILELRSVKRRLNGDGRRSAYKTEDLDKIWHHIMAPCWIFIEISCPLPKDKRLLPDEIRRKLKKGDTRIVRKGYLAQLLGRTEIISSEAVEGSFRRLDPITGKEEYTRIFTFDLHVGMLQFIARIRPRQTQVLPTRILALDPIRQRVEKRLGRYFVQMWRINWRTPEPKAFLVRTLIKEGGIGEIARYNTTQKKITRLEKALDCLVEKRIIPGWQYDHTDFDSGKDPLEKKILIEAPDQIYQIYERIAPDVPRLALPEPSGDLVEDDSPLGVRLKAWRRERRLTQLQMAEKLGISQGMLALVEAGTKKPGKALADKIKSLINQ